MDIGIDWTALPIVALAFLIWGLLHWYWPHLPHPRLPVPSLSLFQQDNGGLRQRLASWPKVLLAIALALFLTAALNPRLHIKKSPDEIPPSSRTPPAVEGIAIYFILDQSGSMQEKAQIYTDEGQVNATKIELLKHLTKAFIDGDPKFGLGGVPTI